MYAVPDLILRKVEATVFSTLVLFSLMALLAHPTVPVNVPQNFNRHGDSNLWEINIPRAYMSLEPTSTGTTTVNGPAHTATHYDYIIVGSGAGGLVAADRLSEAGKKVLVIERGGPSTAETGGNYVPPWAAGTNLTKFDVPGLFQSMFEGVDQFWWCGYPDVYAGCLVGGGTSVNGGLYWYPPDIDFATSGGWPRGWQDHQPYTDKLKARLPSTDAPSPDGRRYLPETFDVVSSLLKFGGFREVNINSVPNHKDRVYGWSSYNFQGGKRAGPVATYLRTAKARSNFKLQMWTTVHSVVRSGSKITGVRTNDTSLGPDGVVPLTAKGRVILSAGAFGSPKILIQSGIGPTDMIRIVEGNATFSQYLPPSSQYINLPVGSNVSDHPAITLVFRHPAVDSYDNWSRVWTNPRPADAQQYLTNQTGVFASSSPRINFWRTVACPDGKTRHVQGTGFPGGYDDPNAFSIAMYLTTGLTSRGRIGLDADLQPRPLQDPWFTDPDDKAALIVGINELVNDVSKVANLTLIVPDLTNTTVQEYVDTYPTSQMGSNHWVGSNTIGTDRAKAVVDVNTKVFGTDNLFVIDASIIPSAPMGNPQGVIMSMTEQAVVKILALPGGP